MFKIMSSACAALMVLTAPLATPALAMPMAAPATAPSAIINVQADGSSPNISPGFDRRWDRRQAQPRWDRNDRRWDRDDRRWDRDNRRVERRGDAYWRGHRGYRDYRPGYRRHGDFWFPPAAFIAGAIIGGALSNQPAPPPAGYYSNAHVEWCYARYRSYRASDNTFQPYNGPRRQCRSPYG